MGDYAIKVVQREDIGMTRILLGKEGLLNGKQVRQLINLLERIESGEVSL